MMLTTTITTQITISYTKEYYLNRGGAAGQRGQGVTHTGMITKPSTTIMNKSAQSESSNEMSPEEPKGPLARTTGKYELENSKSQSRELIRYRQTSALSNCEQPQLDKTPDA